MSESGPENVPSDSRANPGLAEELRLKLNQEVDEGSDTVNQSGEHKIAFDELAQKRLAEITDQHQLAALKAQALQELSSDSGVAPSDQVLLQRKMAEIAARDQA